MQSKWGRRAALVLGAVFGAFGVAESVTHWHDTAAGLIATAWTVVIPVLGMVVIALAVRDLGPRTGRTA